MIVTQTYCDQNTAKISIVHTINNWHASCTWNFKNPLASTYSSFIIHYSKKFLNKWLITNPTELLVIKSFDQENLITERLLFTIRIAHSKAETHEHPTFGQYVFKQYKSIDKGNKRSPKEAKKPYNNYHLQQIDSYNQWRALIQ